MAKEIVRADAINRVYQALDFFDASINRVAAWTVGFRSWQKALLFALLQPNEKLKTIQDNADFTSLMLAQEEAKMMPFSEVWEEYLTQTGTPKDCELVNAVKKYEDEELIKRL